MPRSINGKNKKFLMDSLSELTRFIESKGVKAKSESHAENGFKKSETRSLKPEQQEKQRITHVFRLMRE
jgi:hypothetical protein